MRTRDIFASSLLKIALREKYMLYDVRFGIWSATVPVVRCNPGREWYRTFFEVQNNFGATRGAR